MYYLCDIGKLNKRSKELKLNDYYLFGNGFSEDDCLKIIRDYEGSLSLSPQEHTNQDKHNQSFEIDFAPENLWLYERLSTYALEANNSWDFSISGFSENLELIKYSGETRDSDAPRVDIGNNFNPNFKQYRKISFFVSLSKSEDYEGGDHLMHNYGTPCYAEKEIGTSVFFPSWMLNGVTPVTKGEKYCLRGWIFGPHFK
jgi:hypothetical protein